MKPGEILAIDGRGAYALRDDFSTGFREIPAGLGGESLESLFLRAAAAGYRQIWICPSGLMWLALPLELSAAGRVAGRFLESGGYSTPKGQVLGSWMSVWSSSHLLEVSIPSWDPGSPFRSIDFGPLLLGELAEFSEATGMSWKRSGAITSDAWLRDHFKRNGLLKPTKYPEIARDANLEPDLHFMRAPEGAEKRASKLVAFDVNAMYLGAMSSLALPVGDYEEAHLRRGLVSESLKWPGYWGTPGGTYVTSPSLSYSGISAVSDAYWWTESHRFLEPLYRVLRDGRTQLLHRPDSAALEALKQVYRQGIGRLGSTRRSDPDDVLYQPYWRHAVQAEARCRLLRRIDSLGAKPVAVDVDCLYFLTGGRGDFAQLFADKIGLPVDDQIGHFKLSGTSTGSFARHILNGGFIERERDGRKVSGLDALREGIS